MAQRQALSDTFDNASRGLLAELLAPLGELAGRRVAGEEGAEVGHRLGEELGEELEKLGEILLEPTRESGASADEGALERVVTLEESRKKVSSTLCRDVPPSLASISSEEELRKYSLESLRKLAKNEGLELGKAPSRERVLQELKQRLPSAMY
jgi:hypothetical protein